MTLSEIGEPPEVATTQQRSILDRLLLVSVNRSVLGWSLYQQGRYAEARVELQKAIEIAERESLTTQAIYFRLGQTLEKLDRFDAALEAYFKELAWGAHVAPTQAAITALYRRLHGTFDGLEIAQRTRVNDLVAKRLEVGARSHSAHR